ncbi:helix-turn-helix domain-containing protein [Desulfobacter postgatei]|nr:helix-turn-helix domain-containing protein [Desulfobacter postgatei]MDX9964673.1 helix-turn-helix domain-containing protein [Desulfobacter postgatei]
MSELSRKTGLTRQTLYRLFKNGNPTLKTLVSVLNGLGVRLDVQAQ